MAFVARWLPNKVVAAKPTRSTVEPMQIRVSLLFPALLLAASACGEEKKALQHGPAELSHSHLEVRRVSGRVLAQGEFLGRPGRVEQFGDDLVVLDDLGEAAVHIISARDGRRVRSVGRRGGGPGEFRSAWAITRDPADPRSAWVYDVQLGRLTRVNLATAGNATNPEIINLIGGPNASQPLWVHDTLLVTPNFSADARLAYFGRDGRFRRSAGVAPSDNRGTPVSVLQQAWMGKLASHPSGDRLVLATQYADQLEIYAADGSMLKKVRGPFRFDPLFKVANAAGMATMTFEDGIRMGYSDVIATDEQIFALFSGRTREGYGGNSPFGRYVHIFNWEGDLQHILELDADVISIALSEDGRSLYGVAETPEPVIMAFDLED